MEAVVRAVDLRREFGEVVAVDRLNIEIASGEIFGLVGPDGAGKTTTLRLLCCLVDPSDGECSVAGRDFWAILYQLVRDGLTLFVTTAYLDEAERCNRVALMDRGKLVKVDSPVRLKDSGSWYRVQAPDRMRVREALRTRPGVLSVETSGAALHVLLVEGTAPETIFEAGLFEKIEPSLEDVFIATVAQVS